MLEDQAGFRRGYTINDHIFTLKCQIDLYLSKKKKKLFCAFADFRKVFDTVWIYGLCSKLLSSGISGKLFDVIKSIYNNIKSCVSLNGSNSNLYIGCYMGLRQGENLSLLFFLLLINDMESYFDTNGIPSLKLNNPIFDTLFKIQLLLYADDTGLLANNQSNLQNSLNCLAE